MFSNYWTEARNFPFIEKLPSSTWYLKSIVPGEISLLRKIKKYNHKITTLDIEGLITPNLRDSLKTRFSKKTIDLADAIFFGATNNSLYSKEILNYLIIINYISLALLWLRNG